MSKNEQIAEEIHDGAGAGKYIVGFVISVVLTLASFLPVMNNWIADWSTSAKVIYLLGMALVQMMVQIGFFLHLTEGPDAKWNILTMYSAVVCVFIIVVGSWWVMWHANYQVMGSAGRVEQTDVIYPAKDMQTAPASDNASSKNDSSEQIQSTTDMGVSAASQSDDSTSDEENAQSSDDASKE